MLVLLPIFHLHIRTVRMPTDEFQQSQNVSQLKLWLAETICGRDEFLIKVSAFHCRYWHRLISDKKNSTYCYGCVRVCVCVCGCEYIPRVLHFLEKRWDVFHVNTLFPSARYISYIALPVGHCCINNWMITVTLNLFKQCRYSKYCRQQLTDYNIIGLFLRHLSRRRVRTYNFLPSGRKKRNVSNTWHKTNHRSYFFCCRWWISILRPSDWSENQFSLHAFDSHSLVRYW